MSSDTKFRHEDLQTYFERSASVVRHQLDKFDKTYARPNFHRLAHAFHKRPFRTTFLTTFGFLAFLPVISFVGFSLFILGSFLFIALGAALLASMFAILLSGSILAFTLMALFGVSIFLTVGLVLGFFALRLFVLVRADGPRKGTMEWGRETKGRLVHVGAQGKTQKQPAAAESDTTIRPGGPYIRMSSMGNGADLQPSPGARGEEEFADARSGRTSSGTSEGTSDASTVDSTVVDGTNKPFADLGLVHDEKPIMDESPIMVKKELDFDRF